MTFDSKPNLLLHICCAPCSGWLFTELKKEFQVTVYYDNPNIHPEAEWLKRASEAEKFFKSQGVDFILVDWSHDDWLKITKGLEAEPERGKRCLLCYHYRLKKTAEFAKNNDFSYFACSLSISPHKNTTAINNLGKALAKQYQLNFLAEDWKKNEGYKKAVEFSRENNFYRQSYCGCEFSKLVARD